MISKTTLPAPLCRPRRAGALLACLAAALATQLSAQTVAPTITTQPAGRTVNAGVAVTFTIVASGTAPTYQWTYNGAPIAGATAASYSIASVAPANAGLYAAVATNSAGTATSNNAILLVYTPYIVATIAGQPGVAGSANGTGGAATFSHPQGVAVDAAGNLYVADTLNYAIRKITPAGAVTTLAGQPGVAGAQDGVGSAALFYGPTGIAVDTAGNLYVADTFNSTIRKITPAGSVTTLAGLAPTAGSPSPINEGSANGTGSAARFMTPRGVAVDGAGNVYVADTGNSTIRKITPAGVVTTLAGAAGNPNSNDGTGASARFNYPFGIASDSAGDLWVADTSNSTIRAITPAGVVTTLAGLANNTGSTGGPGLVARFSLPTGLAVDSQGNLYVADWNNSTLREIAPNGTVATLAGLAGNIGSIDASGSTARLDNPIGLAVDANGTVYLADTENCTIRTAVSQNPTFTVPQITTQPVSQTVTPGATVNFVVAASGIPAPTYQWQKNGVTIAGATGGTLILSNVQPSDGASYAAVVTNPLGSVSSATATLTVLTVPVVPPGSQSQTVSAGTSVTLSAANATGGNLSFQWQFGGTNISGASGSTYTLSPIGTNQEGVYSVVVTNSLGSTTAVIGTVTVTANAHLVNLSARASAGAGSNALTAGFLTGGGTKQILCPGNRPGAGQLFGRRVPARSAAHVVQRDQRRPRLKYRLGHQSPRHGRPHGGLQPDGGLRPPRELRRLGPSPANRLRRLLRPGRERRRQYRDRLGRDLRRRHGHPRRAPHQRLRPGQHRGRLAAPDGRLHDRRHDLRDRADPRASGRPSAPPTESAAPWRCPTDRVRGRRHYSERDQDGLGRDGRARGARSPRWGPSALASTSTDAALILTLAPGAYTGPGQRRQRHDRGRAGRSLRVLPARARAPAARPQ